MATMAFPRNMPRRWLAAALASAMLLLAGCASIGVKLQRPDAGIQELTAHANGTWTALVRFQNNNYESGIHVYSIDATLSLDGKDAGHISIAPALDIPGADADVASATFTPEAPGAAALRAAKANSIRYGLKGTIVIGTQSPLGKPPGKAHSFPLHGDGYLSPVPGVSNIWR